MQTVKDWSLWGDQPKQLGLGRITESPDQFDFSSLFNTLDETVSSGSPVSSGSTSLEKLHSEKNYLIGSPPPPIGTGPSMPMSNWMFVKPKLNAFPEKFVNFANCHIRFQVQALNIPPGVHLDASSLHGIVETPSGKLVPCFVRDALKVYPSEMDGFRGSFKASEEVGLYRARFRLLLPMEMYKMERFGVIGEEIEVLVVRNYFRDSQGDAVSFQMPFEPWYPNSTSTATTKADSDENSGSAWSPSKAWGIACDKFTNRLFYTDRTGHNFSCFDPEGQIIYKIGRSSPENNLNRPTGICYDEFHRRVVIADKDNHRISFFDTDGNYISSFGSPGHHNGGFNYPWDVAVSPCGGKIVVTDSRNKRIQLFDWSGNFLGKFSVYETNPFEYKNNFDYPRGVTFNTTGTAVYVTDFNADNILEVPLNMNTFKKILPEKRLRRPQGIAVDAMDGILVCDSKNKVIRHLYPGDSNSLSQIHSIGREKIDYPINIAIMGDGRAAVLDANAKIRIF